MARRNFAEILREANVDIRKEYDRIYKWFYEYTVYIKDNKKRIHFSDFCRVCFKGFSFRGTCSSLDDFNTTHNFNFVENPDKFDVDYLLIFCEYCYNLIWKLQQEDLSDFSGVKKACEQFINQILTVIESIGYEEVVDEESDVSIFVPKNAPAMTVAEILPENLSYKVVEYNNHSLKGDLMGKSEILKLLANQLEPRKDDLDNIDKQFKSDLFYLFNNISIRHNNEDKISNISDDELEEWYDYTYDMSLIAFMLLDKKDHKNEILELKKKLGDL